MSGIFQGYKKRVRLCCKAVQKGLNVNNAQNNYVSYTNIRLICNTNVHNGCSSNWRAHWSKFVGRTYAEVVSSNPSSRSDKNHTHVKQVQNFSVIAQCRSTKSTKPTFLRKNTPVTGKDKTQRTYSASNDPGSGVKSSNAHFCIPVTNRFESLSVLDENNTNCQTESNNSIVILKELHKHHKNSEFESSNLIESQNSSPSVKNVSNSVDQRRGNTRLLNTGTRCTQVKSHHKQSNHEQYNGHPLSHNSTSKMVQVANQKHGKTCPTVPPTPRRNNQCGAYSLLYTTCNKEYVTVIKE